MKIVVILILRKVGSLESTCCISRILIKVFVMSGLLNWYRPPALHVHATMNRSIPAVSSRVSCLAVPLALLLLAGCASKPTVNTVTRGAVTVPQYYTVRAGDTLSKIAMRYNLDYREIARLNNIDDSYIIYTNQSIRLYDSRKNPGSVPVKTAATQPVNAVKVQSIPATVTSSVSTRPANTSPGTLKANPVPAKNTTTPITGVASQPAVSVPVMPASSGIQWQWPADGNIIQQFDPATNVKGLRIGGKVGDTVRAAADGDVVYASNRLVEYGNLVLIRHVNGYVTAYAHNSRILVAENDKIRAGQKIAEMGANPAGQTMLEFQIRLNGKPVNPVNLLPKK